jgi:hypothetical protein
MLPTHIAAEAAKGVLGATRAGGDHHRHGQGLSAAHGPPGRLSGGAPASLGIAKAAGLGSGPGGGLAQRSDGRSPCDR